MSNTDKGGQSVASVDGPLTLVIGNSYQAKYLQSDNQLLSVLYGSVVHRVDVPRNNGYLPSELIYPLHTFDSEFKSDQALDVIQRFDHVPWKDMPKFFRSDEFFEAVLQYLIDESGLSRERLLEARVIMSSKDYFFPDVCSLPEVCRRFFPEAKVFLTGQTGREIPELFDLQPNANGEPYADPTKDEEDDTLDDAI